MKKANKTNNTPKILIAVLALLMVSSIAMIANRANYMASAQDYGDIMQYDWPQDQYDEGHTKFSSGPAPDKPDVLWEVQGYGRPEAVFDGKVFTTTDRPLTIHALDALNGGLKWSTEISTRPDGVARLLGVFRLDDNHLALHTSTGVAGIRISDGELLWIVEPYTEYGHPGGGVYQRITYSTELKFLYTVGYDGYTKESRVYAFDLSNPRVEAPIAWDYLVDKASEILAFGEGKLFLGTAQYCVYALDGETGDLIWEAHKDGFAQYTGAYYDGKLYASGASMSLTCYNATTGNILWNYPVGEKGFFAHSVAVAYGRVYSQNARVSGGFLGCWDAETGELQWQASAEIRYGKEVVVGDGKVYSATVDTGGGAGTAIGGIDVGADASGCFDALTGERLWEVPLGFERQIIAYGNLYANAGNALYCLSTTADPEPWSYFRGNIDTPGVANRKSAPNNLNVKWTYKTGAGITSSPAVVDGKVYIGSHDQNIYCLDAYTGNEIWAFPTEHEVSSSVAVTGGRVYVGPDDGYIYCIDAETGDEIWKTDIYAGNIPHYQFEITSWQPRSSPIIIGSSLYVGALDGKVYCLSTSDGKINWSYATGGPIGGSPAYSNGWIYIASTDRKLYALDATKGDLIWNWTTPKSRPGEKKELFFFGTPTVAEGKVFIGGGGRSLRPRGVILVALNATTGDLIWQVTTDPEGNSNQPYAPTYFDGVVYTGEHMGLSARNATDGSLIWWQWLSFQIFSSAAYANDLQGGKVYVGADSYSLTCLNATDGTPLSVYQTGAQVPSSPAIYDGKVYVGSGDGCVYCFDDTPSVDMSIWAESNKGATMWNNETLEICGQVTAISTYVNPVSEVEELYHPELPNATVKLSLTTPGGEDVALTTTTDKKGEFSFSYSPAEVGEWGWVVYYDGKEKPWITYESAYGEWNQFTVNSATSAPSGDGTQPPPTAAFPMEYVYAAIAVIVIVVVVFVAYFLLKRK